MRDYTWQVTKDGVKIFPKGPDGQPVPTPKFIAGHFDRGDIQKLAETHNSGTAFEAAVKKSGMTEANERA